MITIRQLHLTEFDSVALEGPGSLEVSQSRAPDEYGVVVEADERILPRIKAQISDRRLRLGLDVRWWEWVTWWLAWLLVRDRSIRFHVAMPEVRDVTVYGAGTASGAWIRSDACTLRINGSGAISFDGLLALRLSLAVSGSGTLEVAGEATRMEVAVSGPGGVKAMDCESRDAIVRVLGPGHAAVHAVDTLDVTVAGTGAVTYVGQPRVTRHEPSDRRPVRR
jgi:hypothetical protein